MDYSSLVKFITSLNTVHCAKCTHFLLPTSQSLQVHFKVCYPDQAFTINALDAFVESIRERMEVPYRSVKELTSYIRTKTSQRVITPVQTWLPTPLIRYKCTICLDCRADRVVLKNHIFKHLRDGRLSPSATAQDREACINTVYFQQAILDDKIIRIPVHHQSAAMTNNQVTFAEAFSQFTASQASRPHPDETLENSFGAGQAQVNRLIQALGVESHLNAKLKNISPRLSKAARMVTGSTSFPK
jgi:hypothetical protein